MRVLHVVPSLLPGSGGPSRTVPELCRALVSAGTHVSLLSTHVSAKELTLDPSQAPYEVMLIPAAAGTLTGARQVYETVRQRSGEFDLVHIHSLWNSVVTSAAAACRKTGIPYILAPRGMLSDACLHQHRYRLKRAYSWAYDRRTVEGAARLHFLNEDEARSSRSSWFRQPEYFIARNGIELNLPNSTEVFLDRFPSLKGRRIMLFLGRLHAIKGLDLQLQALERLAPKFPDLVWVLMGPDDGEWERIKGLARAANLEVHVNWVGPEMGPERFSAIAGADVLVQTSLYECQSTTVNEALAVGVPLVVTDSINYNEVQTAGAGIVVMRDADQLANAIEATLQTDDKGEAMRAAGRRFAARELAWPAIAGLVNTAYEDVMSSCSHRNKAPDVWRETLPASSGPTLN